MGKKQIKAALEDAGINNVVVTYSLKSPRGWSYHQEPKPGGVSTSSFLGKNSKESMKTIAAMPDPNKIEEVSVPRGDQVQELDDFGNPVHCNFGVR